MIIGIDLGTTNSLCAVWRDGETVLVPNALGSFLTPSVVSVDTDGTVLVGQAAQERLLTHPDRTAAAFKRMMGTARDYRLGGKVFRAEDLSALVLRQLKADAERFLGHEVGEAIVTVPAYFNDAQRKATKLAGELAGLRVERLLNEPTAAALAYGLYDLEGERRILTLDLGGGTFDVSILEMFDGVMEVRSVAGDNFLGGEDFAEVLVDGFIVAHGKEAKIMPRTHADPAHPAIRLAAERAKRALSVQGSAEMSIVHRGDTLSWTVTRDEYDELCAPLIKRLRAPIERALRDSNLRADSITHLVLAGGATRMQVFRRMVTRLFQRLPVAVVDPDEVVARGAAVQAGLKMRDAALDDVVMTDVAPFTMGTGVVDMRNGQIVANDVYLPIIERNTVIPVSRVRNVSTIRDGQHQLDIPIYQGEARSIRDNVFLGEIKVAIPPAPMGHVSADIRYTYDISGLLEVEVKVLPSGEVSRKVIEGHAGVLTPQEIEERLKKLAHLKVHPAEQAENIALKARGERVYAQSLGDVRQAVSVWIGELALVLQRQDPREIGEFRKKMTEFLDQIDRPYLS